MDYITTAATEATEATAATAATVYSAEGCPEHMPRESRHQNTYPPTYPTILGFPVPFLIDRSLFLYSLYSIQIYDGILRRILHLYYTARNEYSL